LSEKSQTPQQIISDKTIKKSYHNSQHACLKSCKAQVVLEHLNVDPSNRKTFTVSQVTSDTLEVASLSFTHQPDSTKHQVESERILHLATTVLRICQLEFVEEYPEEEQQTIRGSKKAVVLFGNTSGALHHPDRG